MGQKTTTTGDGLLVLQGIQKSSHPSRMASLCECAWTRVYARENKNMCGWIHALFQHS